MGRSAMPVTLSIKNVPDDVAQRLRERAARHHRSLQGELLAIVEAVTEEELSAELFHERVRALGLASTYDSTQIVRRDRDSR